MNKTELTRRYLVFALGLVTNAFGVAFMTKADLGTSPIAGIPYTLSLMFQELSFGMFSIIFNLSLILLQWAIEKSRADKIQLFIQAIFAVTFGSCIDLAMMCLHSFNPEMYIVKIISLLAGCCILAFGAYLEIIANVAMLPADAFVRAISNTTGKAYGSIKIVSDVTMTLIAVVMGFIAAGTLLGVREGTVIAAIITGQIVKVNMKILKLDALISSYK